MLGATKIKNSLCESANYTIFIEKCEVQSCCNGSGCVLTTCCCGVCPPGIRVYILLSLWIFQLWGQGEELQRLERNIEYTKKLSMVI